MKKKINLCLENHTKEILMTLISCAAIVRPLNAGQAGEKLPSAIEIRRVVHTVL